MRMVDLTITYGVILIQEYGCSLENEFTELTYERISDGALYTWIHILVHYLTWFFDPYVGYSGYGEVYMKIVSDK